MLQPKTDLWTVSLTTQVKAKWLLSHPFNSSIKPNISQTSKSKSKIRIQIKCGISPKLLSWVSVMKKQPLRAHLIICNHELSIAALSSSPPSPQYNTFDWCAYKNQSKFPSNQNHRCLTPPEIKLDVNHAFALCCCLSEQRGWREPSDLELMVG